MFTVALFYIDNYTELLSVLNYSLICFYMLKKADFLQWFYMNKDRILAQIFISRCRYRDDILSLENSRIGEYLHLIYSNELEIKDTADTYNIIDNGAKNNNNTLFNRSSVAICHNGYVTTEIVPCTVIF